MPVYTWAGRTRQGTSKKGVLEAVNEAAVMAQLRSQGIVPSKVKEKPKELEDIFPFLQPGIKTKEGRNHDMDWEDYHPIEDMYSYLDYLEGTESN